MSLKIKIYQAEKVLKQSFTTSSGCLKKKTIFQVLIYEDQRFHFIYELPLSPSLGEMPDEIKATLLRDQLHAFQTSTHLKRALSWCHMMLKDYTDFLNYQPLQTFLLETFGIGDWPLTGQEKLVRLKCNLQSVESLITYSWTTSNQWSVDFNGSLEESTWLYFTRHVNFKNCVWIEQPLPACQLTHALARYSSAPIYADEEMAYLSPSLFLTSPFKGFILKPIRHDYAPFMEWLYLAQQFKIPCIIGNNVCDTIALALCQFFNQVCTVRLLEDSPLTSFFHGNFFEKELFKLNKGQLTINDEVVDFVEQNYSLLYSSENEKEIYV